MSIKTISESNLQILFTKLARELADFLTHSKDKDLVVALPGGRSVVGLLSALTEPLESVPAEKRQRLQFFMVDERVVPLDSPDSNYLLLREGFFDKAISKKLIKADQVHPFDITTGPLPKVIENYGKKLLSYGGRYTAAVLGVGEDAHVGALFPNHHSINDRSPLYMSMTDSPKPPPLRMTSSRELISKTGLAIPLFIGEAKRESLNKFLAETPVELCPVAMVRECAQAVIGTDLET